MCLLCVEINKQTLSGKDFAKNLEEILFFDPKHAEEITKALSESNPDYLDKLEKELMDALEDNLFDFYIKQ